MTSDDCIFCKMIQGSISVPKLYEDDLFICIRDINPQAKIHLLVFPKDHIATLPEVFTETFQERSPHSLALMAGFFATATKVASQQGLLPGGFRLVLNTGKDAGQTVFHIHLHILGGEILKGSFGSNKSV